VRHQGQFVLLERALLRIEHLQRELQSDEHWVVASLGRDACRGHHAHLPGDVGALWGVVALD
jgi:hypothetical protein